MHQVQTRTGSFLCAYVRCCIPGVAVSRGLGAHGRVMYQGTVYTAVSSRAYAFEWDLSPIAWFTLPLRVFSPCQLQPGSWLGAKVTAVFAKINRLRMKLGGSLASVKLRIVLSFFQVGTF